MQTYHLKKSSKKGKKYDLISPDNKVVSFGAAGYEDLTSHHDKTRQKAYIARHQPLEQKYWSHTSPITASYMSRHLLWSNPDLKVAANTIAKKRGIRLVIDK